MALDLQIQGREKTLLSKLFAETGALIYNLNFIKPEKNMVIMMSTNEWPVYLILRAIECEYESKWLLNSHAYIIRKTEKTSFFSWYVDMVNIFFILFSVLKCSHLSQWTLVSLHMYSCQKKWWQWPTSPTTTHLQTPLYLCLFFLSSCLFLKTISEKPQTLLINTHWKKVGRGEEKWGKYMSSLSIGEKTQ